MSMFIKYLFTNLFFTLFTCFVFSQEHSAKGTFVGIIQDSASHIGVEYATVIVERRTGKIIGTGVADKTGNFKIENITSGNYSIAISAAGYISKKLPGISVDSGGSVINLGTIILSRTEVQLKSVVVNANKPLVKQEVDRIIYDIQADPDSKVGNLWLILPKVPMISIDADDKILLKGGRNFKVLLNGRSSVLVANKPEDVFKLLPAGSIERIEIITVPPAKYDAEGLSGIINVVMKKNIGQKYIGSLNETYGPLLSTISGFFTEKGSRLGFSLSAGESWERMPSSAFNGTLDNFSSSPYSLSQNGNKRYNGATTTAGLQADYELDSLRLLTASAGIRALNNHDYTNQYTFLQKVNNPASLYGTNSLSALNDKDVSFGLNYEAMGRRNKNQIFTISYNYGYSPSTQNNTNEVKEIYNYPSSRLQQLNKTLTREQTYQADYTIPAGVVNIGVGAKMILRNNSADYTTAYYDSVLSSFITDTSNSDGFKYRQHIYALYNSYLIKTKKWAMSAGGRFERTNIDANFANADQPVKQWYNNLIPSITIQRVTGKFSNINIGYTQRIQRPAIWQLNSFVNKSDPAFYVAGNKDLHPVTSQVITINYSWFKKGSLQTGFDYSFSSNTIQRVTTFVNDSISYTSFQNIGKNEMLSLHVSFNYSFSKAVSFSLNGLASYVWMSGTVMNEPYTNSGVQGNAYCYLSFRLKKNWRAALNGGFYSPTVVLQGQSSGFFYSSLRIMKTVWKNKLTMFASVTNPYQEYRTLRNKLNTPSFIQDYSYLKVSRTFNVGITYNFGKLKEELKKVKRGIQNDDTSTKKIDSEKGAQ